VSVFDENDYMIVLYIISTWGEAFCIIQHVSVSILTLLTMQGRQ